MLFRAFRDRVRGFHHVTKSDPTGTRETTDYFVLADTQKCEARSLVPQPLLLLSPILPAIRHYRFSTHRSDR